MIGGRLLHSPGGAPVRFTVSLQGEALASWEVQLHEPSFLRMWQLPARRLTAPHAYVPVEITAAPVGSTHVRDLDVRISQFDFQSEGSVVHGFGRGWHQSEFDGAAPNPWRWTSASADLLVHAPDKNLVLHLIAEVPLEHLRGAPQIVVRAGSRVLSRTVAHDEAIDLAVPISAQALAGAAGVITIEIDRTFVPHDAIGNEDRRRLGLRAYQVDLREEPVPDANTRQLQARGQPEPVTR